MFNSHSDLINASFTSSRQCLEGFYYFDTSKGHWRKISKSSFVYVSFEYVFGARWAKLHHVIEDSSRATSKQAAIIEGCHYSIFATKFKA